MSRIALAVVTDARSRHLTTLTEDDFVVREGGDERDVLSVHLADYPIIVLLDNGRQESAAFEATRRAVERFIGRIGAERTVAIGTLADPPAILTTFEDDRTKLDAAFKAVHASGSADSLVFEGVAEAARLIRRTGSPFSAIVVISATEARATRAAAGELLPAILDSRTMVHIIARRAASAAPPSAPDAAPDALRSLAEQTRGQYTLIFSVASYQAALDRLADRLSAEMMIEFMVPAESPAGDAVRVGVRIPGARVLGLGVTRR